MEPNKPVFSEMETDAIGEIMNISLGSSATSVSTMLDRPVNITTPRVEVMLAKNFEFANFEPAIGVEIEYVSGLSGKNVMIMKESDVKVIVGLLLQTDFTEQEFVMDEMSVGAICEVMNQMMGASSTALSQFLNRPINISPPNSFSIENSDQFKNKYFDSDGPIVAVYFNLMVDDLVNSEFISIMTVELAKELVSMFGFGGDDGGSADAYSAPAEAPAPTPAPAPAAAPAPVPSAPAYTPPAMDPAAAYGMPPAGYPQQMPAGYPQAPAGYPPQYAMPPQSAYAPPPAPAVNYNVSQAPLPVFDQSDIKLTEGQNSNLSMIMSVPLEITVEIGRTKRKIKDILDFTSGTIVELEKQAGSHVDVYVNGKPIAQGDVVVVDDFYGVRITDVCSNSEILNSL